MTLALFTLLLVAFTLGFVVGGVMIRIVDEERVAMNKELGNVPGGCPVCGAKKYV